MITLCRYQNPAQVCFLKWDQAIKGSIISNKVYQRDHYKKNKEYYKEKREIRRKELLQRFHSFKSTLKCSICGESDPVTIDLHHLDPTLKDELVYKLVHLGCSWSKIVIEFEKCVALCSNCHRKVHAYQEWTDKINETHLIKVGQWDCSSTVRAGNS